MIRAMVCVRLRPFVVFAFILSLIILQAPLLAAGPAQVQGVPTTGPKIWLQSNQPLAVVHTGPAATTGLGQPLALASADIDGDGIADLVVGYSAPGGGVLAIHRGNLDAFAPQSDASLQAVARGEFPSPFLLEANTLAVPVRPDFIAIGNFIGNGNQDLVVAAKGGTTLLAFPGDGKGNFGSPQTINLPGGVTSLAAGQFGVSHQPSIVVGLSTGKNNSELAVFAGTPQGLTPVAALPVAGAISNILFGDFGGGPDVAFLAGGKVQILRSSTGKLATVSAPVSAAAFALGLFIYDRNRGDQIALLAADGSVQIVARSDFDPRVYSSDEFGAIRRAKINHLPSPAFVPQSSFPTGWTIVESFPAIGAVTAGQAPLFFQTRVSSNGADDVMWLNPGPGQMAVISHADVPAGSQTFAPGQVSVKAYNGSPVGAVAARINVDGRPGVIAIHNGEVAPSLLMPIPDPTFTVNRTDDPVPTSPIGNACNGVANDCSLREAVLRANATPAADTIILPAGTYTLTRGRIASPLYDAHDGTLNINDPLTITGAVDGSGNPASIITWGTLTSGNSVDMIFAVNEDIPAPTAASGTFSNLVIENGVNHGTHSNDGDGGCMEYDTGTNGTATLSLTNVTIQNCSTLQGGGGGLVIFNFLASTTHGTAGATITSSIFQGNSVVDSGSAGNGGGIAIAQDGHMTMTGSKVLNNSAVQTCTPTCGLGDGGGIIIFAPQNISATSAETFIHSSTISGNKSAGFGGGIEESASISIDTGTVISGNIAGTDGSNNTAHANQEGGGLYLNPAASCPLASACSVALSKVVITGNTATGNGGGLSYGNGSAGTVGALTMNFSRLAGNTTSGGSGSNFNNNHGSAGVTNNWWGTNNAASTINTISGTTTFDPFIVLTHIGNPQKIRINQSSTLTGDMSKDNHGATPPAGATDEIVGLPITFDGAVLGTIPQAQPETLNASAQATATFNAGGTAGFGTANATVDQAVVPVNSNLIASATESGTTATITTVGAHGYSVGEFVRISGVGVAGYNSSPATQVFAILSTPTATTFTYTANASGLGSSSGGTANASIVILQPPSITKSFNPKTVAKNTASTITFSITNSNVVPINASFTDNLPANVGTTPGSLVVAGTPAVVNNCGGSVTATAGTGSISFSNTLLPIGTCTIQVNVSSTVDNTYSNSVTINSTDAGNGNTSSDTLTVINPPTIVKVFGAATIPLNGTTGLHFTISSSNANETLSAISFTDSLPAGLVVATPNGLTNNCSTTPTATAGSSSISLSGASLAPGASCTIVVNVQGTTAGTKNNSVTVSDATAGTGNTSNASITVVAPPTISKAFGAASIPLNGTTTVTFTINNPNTTAAGDLTGVAFSDTLPNTTGTIVVAATPGVVNTCNGTVTATAGTGVISLSGGTVAHNASCTLTVNVTGTAAGDANNTTGAITSNEGGTGVASNTATVKIVAPPTISKAFGAASIPLNGTTTTTFTITNPAANTTAENGIAFSDTLTGGLQVASTPGVTNTCGGTVTAAANSTSISLTGGSIATPGTTCTVVVNVTGTQAGTVTNTTGAVSSTNGGTGATSNTATLSVVAPPSITKQFGATSIPLNGTTSLTFTIQNPNTSATLNGLAFTDSLPAGLVVATPNGLSNTCGGTATATAGSGTVSLAAGTLAANASCTVSVNVQGTTAGVKNNSVQVTSTEGGAGNTSNASITVVAPPTIAKAFGAASIPLNGTTTVTFTISNPNTTAAGDLTGVAFSDTLPASGGPGSATLLVAATPGVVNTCNGTVTATAGTGVISLSGGTVAHGASCTLTVNVTGTVSGDANNTTGAISSTQGGTGLASNTATVKVVAPPTISKAFGATDITLNGTTTTTFTISNPAANTTAENGIAFSDTLTNGLQVASTPGVSNTCGGTVTAAANSTSISLTGGSIATPGTSCTIVVNVTGTQSGTVTNTTGAVSSTNGGTGATSNTATLIVASPATVTKSFGATKIPLNGTTSLTINITNPNTNVSLTGLSFTDSLPAGLVIATPNGLTNSCGGTATATAGSGSLSLSGGTVAASASCAVSVNVQGTTAGDKNNSVTVTSTEGGQSAAASASITVVAPPTIAKAFGAASIPLNGTTSLTFTISNPNTSTNGDLSGVAFSDTLPVSGGPGSATLVVAATPGVTNTCGGTVTATAGTGVISLSGGSVAHNASCTLTVNVTGTVEGDANNTTGAITSTEGGTGTASNTALVKVVAPPTISKAFGAADIPVNGTTTTTFTITNPAANTTAENGIAFSDVLTGGLQVASTPGVSNTCSGTVTAAANSTSISLTGGSIATPGATCTIVVNVTGTQSGIVTNTTSAVSSTNGGTGATSNTATLTVASPPTITKGFAPATITQGGTSTLSFSINNPNANVALTGIAFTDNLPSGVVVAPTPNASNTCGGTFAPSAGATSFSLSGGTLAAAASCAMSVDVQATTAGVKLNTTSAITSSEGGTGAASNTASLTVNKADTTTTVTSSVNPSVFGQSVTFTATVSAVPPGLGTPTGTVTFLDGGSPIGTATLDINGQATFTTSGLAVGNHTITTSYPGDGNFNGGTGSLTGNPQVVNPAFSATTVISSVNPSVFGQSVTFTATVSAVAPGSGIPSGVVTFLDGGSPIGTATLDLSGHATFTTSALAIGNHTITTTYPGDGNFTSSTGSLTGNPQVVTKPNTTTTVNSSAGTITLGDTVTFTATVTVNPPGSGTPSGLVTFFDGSTPIGAGVLNQGGPDQATFSTSLLAVGSHSIAAIYNGDTTFAASPLSSTTTETVNLRATATSVVLNPTTVGAGQASNITLTVTDGGPSTPPGAADVFTPTGAPATGRTGFSSTLFADGLVLVAGGTGADGTTVLNSAEIYSVSAGTFSSTGNLNSARTGAIAVLLPNGKVLVAGGSGNGTASGALNTAELFDPGAGTFAVAGSGSSNVMTAARFGATATLLNTGKVLIAGGINSGGVLNSAELYDPSTDTFTSTGNLNAARTGAAATLLGTGKVLVAGGSSDGTATGALNSAEVFDPAGNAGAGSFASVAGSNPTLATGRWQPEAALLLSGKVLVAGGQNSGGPLTSADLYDPAADSFTATAHAMNEARANGSAIALPNGMVLLPGGTTSQTVDLYDADGDNFNLTGSLQHHFNQGPVSTLLNNGQVLVVGINIDNAPTPLLSDGELYSPSFNPLGTVALSSSEPTDVFGAACVLKPSTSTASTCTSSVTPEQVATSPHTITGTYPADAVHSGSNNSASLTVVPTAAPTIAKAFSAANVAQNGTVGVTFTIVNPNPAATLTGISFTDALPAGLVVATPNNLNSNCGGTFTAVAGSSSLSLTGGTVGPASPPPLVLRGKTVRSQTTPASGQCVITLNLLVTGTGTISNTTGPISANESGPGNPSNTATINVILAPTVNKAFGAAQIPLNATTSLTFNIANPNTATTLVNTSLTDALPSGLVVATPNGLTGSCVAISSISAAAGSTSISLSSLNLGAAASCSFSVNVTGTTGGTKNNTTSPITSTFDDGSATFVPITGGTASASITVLAPDLTITKTHTENFQVGHVSDVWTITVSNVGLATTSGTVTVIDNLPSPLHQTSMSGTGWNCKLNTLTCTRSDVLAVNASYPPITLAVAVPLNAGSSVVNSVTVSGGGETNTANDTATDPTTINPLPGPPLKITPVTDHVTIGQGGSGTLTFTVTSATPLLGGINFSCAGLPALTTCNFDKQGETDSTSQVTLTLTTTANTAANLPVQIGRAAPVFAVLLFPLIGLVSISSGRKKSRKKLLRTLAIFGGLIVLMALMGCGGRKNNGTPTGSFPLQITAASSATPSVQASTTVTLTVQ